MSFCSKSCLHSFKHLHLSSSDFCQQEHWIPVGYGMRHAKARKLPSFKLLSSPPTIHRHICRSYLQQSQQADTATPELILTAHNAYRGGDNQNPLSEIESIFETRLLTGLAPPCADVAHGCNPRRPPIWPLQCYIERSFASYTTLMLLLTIHSNSNSPIYLLTLSRRLLA